MVIVQERRNAGETFPILYMEIKIRPTKQRIQTSFRRMVSYDEK